MSIARFQYEGIGARIYTPEGPYGSLGQPPFPSFQPGEVNSANAEGEVVFLLIVATAGQIVNQGDMIFWDATFRGAFSVTGAGGFPVGASCGTLFLGGYSPPDENITSPQPPNLFTSTLVNAGVYGVWAQRAGASLVKAAASAAAGKSSFNSTAVLGQSDTAASPPAGSFSSGPASIMPTGPTFTANTVSGSSTLSAASTNKGLEVGMQLSGTGITAGTYIKDVNGATVTMSAPATAAGTGVAITASKGATIGNTTSGSNIITGVPSIPGIYPNQTITGTGVPAATTIIGIAGTQGSYSIYLSANATATGSAIALTTSGYVESLLHWPTITAAN